MRRWKGGNCEQRTTCGHYVHKLGGKNTIGYLADKNGSGKRKCCFHFICVEANLYKPVLLSLVDIMSTSWVREKYSRIFGGYRMGAARKVTASIFICVTLDSDELISLQLVDIMSTS